MTSQAPTPQPLQGRLSGHAAFVTGAARGLGRAIAGRLAAEGAAVAVADVDLPAAEEAAAQLQGDGARAIAVAVDVRDSSAVAAAVERAAAELGVLDILVNNAGVVRDARLEAMSDEDWDLVLDVDLRGYFVCARACLPHLRAGGWGRIVNISSRAYQGNPGQANYSAAKAGVVGLTRALSAELGREGITVNAVAPGAIDTALVRAHPKMQEIVDRAIRMQPIKRLGTPEDVAAAVAFLASDDAAFISGDVLHVSGGRFG
ncbi:MAG TPA: SDR family NAD(P)-dependent oxidoreductase [Candidatus Dormibacteraeota bacterium]|jgi:3-oxoacyl-[acyl-carrier protein] reductase|nr:SDR family NAD(P)-dependent oxidoreductase [Candidatus Dormibacteraeota bacterium]